MTCDMELSTFREFLPKAPEAFFLFPNVDSITLHCSGTEVDNDFVWNVSERRQFKKLEGEWRLVSSDTGRELNYPEPQWD